MNTMYAVEHSMTTTPKRNPIEQPEPSRLNFLISDDGRYFAHDPHPALTPPAGWKRITGHQFAQYKAGRVYEPFPPKYQGAA